MMKTQPANRPFSLVLVVLLPAVIVGIVYAPALLDHGFVWDDKAVILESPVDPNAAGWLDALRGPLPISPNYFRPLAVLTYLVELRIFGPNPTVFHLTNLAVHCANTSLVSLLVFLLAGAGSIGRDAGGLGGGSTVRTRWLPALSGVVYGLHPALTEAVVFVSGRFDLLCTFFVLLGLSWTGLFRRHGSRRFGGCALAFLLAALSKETAVAFPLILILWIGALAREGRTSVPWSGSSPADRNRDPLRLLGGIAVAGIVYLAIRFASLGYLLHPGGDARVETGNLLQHALLVARSAIEYAALAVWPFTTLTPIHHTELPVPVTSPVAWVAVACGVVLLASVFMAIRRGSASGWLLLAGSVALLPAVNMMPLNLVGGAFAAERYLVLPLALLVPGVLLAASPLAGSGRVTRLAGSLVVTIWLVACVLTIRTVLPHWRSNFDLWTWTTVTAPLSPVPHANLANALNDRGEHEAALAAATLAVERDDDSGLAWNSLGRTYFLLGRLPDALEAFDRATRLEPGRALFWSNFGGALLAVNRIADAEVVLRERALALDPANGFAHSNLGLIYIAQGKRDLARDHLEQARRLLPSHMREGADALLRELESVGP